MSQSSNADRLTGPRQLRAAPSFLHCGLPEWRPLQGIHMSHEEILPKASLGASRQPCCHLHATLPRGLGLRMCASFTVYCTPQRLRRDERQAAFSR